jgi:hypothetical protein
LTFLSPLTAVEYRVHFFTAKPAVSYHWHDD